MMSVNSAILGYGYGVERHALSTIFQLTVAVSFIGGENHRPAASH